MNLNFQIEGLFQPFAVRKDEVTGEELSRRALAPLQRNLYTNYGLDRLAAIPMSSASVCFVGTGTTPPAPTDTQLAQFKAANTGNYQGTAFSGSPLAEMQTADVVWGGITHYFEFAPGTAVGNITELGIAEGTNPAGYNLHTRALIKDGSGNPTSITVEPGEYLYIAYTRRIYINAKEVPGTITIGSQVINISTGLYRCGTETGDYLIGQGLQYGGTGPRQSNWGPRSSIRARYAERANGTPVTGDSGAWDPDVAKARRQSLGAESDNAAVTVDTYVPGSYTLSNTCTFPPNVGNRKWSGIQYDVGWMNFRIQFLTEFRKSPEYTLTFRIGITWSRYTP